MPTMLQEFNWGDSMRNGNPELTRQMSQAYANTSLVVNTKISKVVQDIDAPTPLVESQVNKNMEIGDIWVNKLTNAAWIMTSRTTDLLVTWTLIT